MKEKDMSTHFLKFHQASTQKLLVNHLVLLAHNRAGTCGSPEPHGVQELVQLAQEEEGSVYTATLCQLLCVLLQLGNLGVVQRGETIDLDSILLKSSRQFLISVC